MSKMWSSCTETCSSWICSWYFCTYLLRSTGQLQDRVSQFASSWNSPVSPTSSAVVFSWLFYQLIGSFIFLYFTSLDIFPFKGTSPFSTHWSTSACVTAVGWEELSGWTGYSRVEWGSGKDLFIMLDPLLNVLMIKITFSVARKLESLSPSLCPLQVTGW